MITFMLFMLIWLLLGVYTLRLFAKWCEETQKIGVDDFWFLMLMIVIWPLCLTFAAYELGKWKQIKLWILQKLFKGIIDVKSE